MVYAYGIQREGSMPYTSHGYMTPADLADHQKLYDTGPHPDCPGHEEGVGFVYCSVNEDCPGDGFGDGPVGECPGTPHRGHARPSEPCPLNDDDR
jgi:hypothetical protein